MEELLDNSELPCVNFQSPVNIDDVINGGMTFEINFNDFENKESDESSYASEDLLKHCKIDCLDVQDDECFDGSPFESIAAKMQNIIPNGGVKKRIVREGYGEVVPIKSMVYIDYNAYLEYNDEPFDSSYVRKKTMHFIIAEGYTIPGLDIGVQSMKVNEKAQFLVTPEYGYGKLGCLGRVPPNSSVLFEVELKRFVNSGAAITHENLPEEQQNQFKHIYKFALALCEKGNDLVRTYANHKLAIRQYNIAAGKLENSQVADYDEQEKMHKLLVRLYTNLAVCYLKLELPRKCCINCNKIYHLAKGTSLEIPAKVFFNNARALIMLNDLTMAEKRLRMAADRNRDNSEIVKCFLTLNKLKEKQIEQDQKLEKILVRQPSNGENLKKYIVKLLHEFNDNEKVIEMKLPPKLNAKEIDFIKVQSVKHAFSVKGEKQLYFMVKPNN